MQEEQVQLPTTLVFRCRCWRWRRQDCLYTEKTSSLISYDVHLPDVGLAYGLQRERVVEGLLGATKEAVTSDGVTDIAEE